MLQTLLNATAQRPVLWYYKGSSPCGGFADAYWNGEDHNAVVVDYLLPAGTSRGGEAGVLHTHCTRDGEGAGGVEGAHRVPREVLSGCGTVPASHPGDGPELPEKSVH